ncbi:hypothetical protein ANN_05528 [Periplaneta americana]|uniref:Uncharacterized protein n=1 Tax=Periplaneta americana TaxID=6978 RepID=A0ABQ8TD47_PERAM|nr:hypothetical protein ANN_05528 [Periplaneta americana]
MAGLCEGGNEPPGSLKATLLSPEGLSTRVVGAKRAGRGKKEQLGHFECNFRRYPLEHCSQSLWRFMWERRPEALESVSCTLRSSYKIASRSEVEYQRGSIRLQRLERASLY